MNATKAKKLRKLAMDLTDTALLERAVQVQGISPQYQLLMGVPIKVQKGIPMSYHRNCSYRVYKDLKKSV